MIKKLMNCLRFKVNSMPVQAKAAIVFMIANFCNMGFNFLATPFFTRLMPETEIGIISVFGTWRNILSIVVTLNLSYGIYEVFLIKHENDKKRMTQSLIGITTILCSAFIILVLVFRSFFVKQLDLNLEYLIILCFEIYSMSIVNFWMTQKRFEYDYKIYGIVIVSINFLKVAISLAAVLLFPENRVFAKLLGWAIPYYALAVVLLAKHTKNFVGIDFKKYSWPAIKYNAVLIPHYLSNILLGSADKIIISRIVGNGPTGIYSISSACASAVSVALSSINTAFTPYVYQKLKIKDFEDINNVSKMINIVTIGVCMAATLIGPEIFKIFAPPNYYKGIILLPSLFAGVYMSSLYALFSNVEFYFKYNHLTSIATLTGGAINIATNFLFIPIFGFQAAAYTTLGSYAVIAAMHMWFYICISKKEGIAVFDCRFLLLSSVLYAAFSIGVVFIYEITLLRYMLFLMVILVAIWKRKFVLTILKQIKKEK